MLLFRILLLLLLLAGLVCFGLYLATGRPHYRVLGIRIVKWTVAAGLAFFVVLIADRLVHMA